MTIEQTRAKIVASIWQAVAQSGVDLSKLPPDQPAKLVDRIADSVMVTMNSILDEVPRAVPEPDPLPGDEDILWEGRPFLSMVESYVVTTERIRIIHGLLGRDVDNYELIRIQDIDFKQSLGERMMGIGDISIRGADASKGDIILRNISKPDEVYEILRRAWLDARKRYGLQFREYM